MVVWVEAAILDDEALLKDKKFQKIKDKLVTFKYVFSFSLNLQHEIRLLVYVICAFNLHQPPINITKKTKHSTQTARYSYTFSLCLFEDQQRKNNIFFRRILIKRLFLSLSLSFMFFFASNAEMAVMI